MQELYRLARADRPSIRQKISAEQRRQLELLLDLFPGMSTNLTRATSPLI